MHTFDDLRRLGRARFEHLTQVVPPLRKALLHLDLEYVFHIHCTTPAQVDRLLAAELRLRQKVRQILGCHQIKIWFVQEEIWSSEQSGQEWFGTVEREAYHELESGLIRFEDSDMVASVEAPTAVSSIVQETAKAAIEPAVDRIVQQELRNYIGSDEFKTLIVERTQNQLRSLLSLNDAPEPEAIDVEATHVEPATKPPFAIHSNYSTTLYAALAALIPDTKEQLTMLTQIQKGTKKGTEWVEKVAGYYPEARREKAKSGLTKPETIERVRARLKRGSDAQDNGAVK